MNCYLWVASSKVIFIEKLYNPFRETDYILSWHKI